MAKALKACLYLVAALAISLGLWGIVSNLTYTLAITLTPKDEKPKWNFFGKFEEWEGPASSSRPKQDEYHHPWWAISFQTPCPYLDPWLFGWVGYGFYGLCLAWGAGTAAMLRWQLGPGDRPPWPFLFWSWWSLGLTGILIHLVFFGYIVHEAASVGMLR